MRGDGPCMCGATDCPSCGRAQGYRVAFSPLRGYYNPGEDDDDCDPEMEREDEIGEDE